MRLNVQRSDISDLMSIPPSFDEAANEPDYQPIRPLLDSAQKYFSAHLDTKKGHSRAQKLQLFPDEYAVGMLYSHLTKEFNDSYFSPDDFAQAAFIVGQDLDDPDYLFRKQEGDLTTIIQTYAAVVPIMFSRHHGEED